MESEELKKMSDTLIRIEVDLRHHIRRTDIAERKLDILEKWVWLATGAIIMFGASPMVKELYLYWVS